MVMLNHNVLVQNQTGLSDGLVTHDLSVNPLSMLLINLRPLNNTGTLTNFADYFAICSAINLLTVRFRGQSIIAMRGQELCALAVMRHNYQPWRANPADTDDERLHVTLPVFLGKHAYDPRSCFPETRRGEFELEMDLDIADTGYDGLTYGIEAVELLGAKPSEFERKIQLTQTFAATGINDVDLPIGNLVRGCMLFGTTAAGGASPAPSWGRLQVVADGVGVIYSGADWETLYNMTGFRASPPVGDHLHGLAEGTPNTIGVGAHVGESFENNVYLDFDPTRNDFYSLDASKVSRLQLRADAETANAVRVVPVERMTPSQLAI